MERRWRGGVVSGLLVMQATVPAVNLPAANLPAEKPAPANPALPASPYLRCGDTVAGATIAGPDANLRYVFAAGQGDRITFETFRDPAQRPLNTVVEVRDACCRVTLASNNDKAFGDLYSRLSWCTPAAGRYCLVVRGYDGSVGGFQATLECTASPEDHNDTCEAALSLPCGAFAFHGDTSCSANDYDPGQDGCTRFAATGSDVVYAVKAVPGMRLHLSYRSDADASIYIVRDCADIAGTCVAGADRTLLGEAEDLQLDFGDAGRYYVVLDHHGGGHGMFTLVGDLDCPAVAVETLPWQRVKRLYQD